MKTWIKIACLCFVVFAMNSGARAQEIFGESAIYYDDPTQTVTAICDTDLDYYAQEYYEARVSCTIRNGAGSQVAYAYQSDTWQNGYAEATTLPANTQPDTQYTVTGVHSATLNYFDYDYDMNQHLHYTYYDYFNFSWWIFQYIDADCCYSFYGPGPTVTRNASTLTVGNSHDQVRTPVARPTNFRQDGAAIDLGNGAIGFNYLWDSSSGRLSDLSACQVGEYVTYPGIGNYSWQSPPYPTGYSTDNPTIINAAATLGVGQDVHLHGADGFAQFVKPYRATTFDSAQQYRWSCTNYQNGQWFSFVEYTIERSVNQHSFNANWYYTITKAGSSVQLDPLP